MGNLIKKLLREGLFIDAAMNEITNDLSPFLSRSEEHNV